MINLSSPSAIKHIQKINEKIDLIKAELKTESRYMTQGAILRSKIRWTAEAEHNTKYFFSLEKNRSLNKQMTATRLHSGQITYNSKQILKEQQTFYEKLYTSDRSVKLDYKNESDPVLDKNQINNLQQDITLEELSKAIKDMPRHKSPGSDSIPADF